MKYRQWHHAIRLMKLDRQQRGRIHARASFPELSPHGLAFITLCYGREFGNSYRQERKRLAYKAHGRKQG